MKKTYFNWSSGKDASLALYQLQQSDEFHVDRLITSVNAEHDRVSMHGLRKELLILQAASIGLPLDLINLPAEPTMEVYNSEMNAKVEKLKMMGYTDCAFGDIYLEDLRAYRENQLKDIQCHFPLWKRDTKELIHEFLELGFKAVIICVDANLLDPTFLGRVIDESLIHDLPPNVDPCGENGEFHTFCFNGPIFRNEVKYELGEKVLREYKSPKLGEPNMGFWFIDLYPISK